MGGCTEARGTARSEIGVSMAAAVAAMALLAAIGPGTLARETVVEVVMGDDFFEAPVVRVPAGATVVWVNEGRNPHNVMADDGSFDSGLVAPGEAFRLRLDRPGRYAYYCAYHGAAGGVGMAGVVVVEAAEAGDAVAADEGPVHASPGRSSGERIIPPPPSRPEGPYRVLRVPVAYPTIQAAVDDARPGDLVLVAPGVYHEEVRVTTPFVTIRGLDRNGVILDGEFKRANGIAVLGADGVVIENMTARHYTLNGFYWNGVLGYRGSYLTAYNNGDYGLYAFDSIYGQFDHSYASGHPDSGFYIGQCKPCHALITDVVAEHNALGYSGTNAGGDLTIRDSVWRYNMAGIVPNTLDSEKLAPQDGVRIVRNRVYSNHNRQAPAKALQYPSFGNGIVVAGGIHNVIEGNWVWDHPEFGILIVPNLDEQFWVASGHRVQGNVVWASGRADLALGFPAGAGTCFAGNRYDSSRPGGIEWLYGCGSLLLRVGGGDLLPTLVPLRRFLEARRGDFEAGDWRSQPVPPPQPGMPDPLAPPAPPWPTPESEVTVPPYPAPLEPVPAEAVSGGFDRLPPAARPLLREVAGVVLFWLPAVIDLGMVGLVVADLIRRRRSMAWPGAVAWGLLAVAVPYAGAVAYALARLARRRARSAAA